MAALQHIARNHSGVFARLFVSGEFIALWIGNRFPSAHCDIEKIPWHSKRISERSKGCCTQPDKFPHFIKTTMSCKAFRIAMYIAKLPNVPH
jgi:hypothetical protein